MFSPAEGLNAITSRMIKTASTITIFTLSLSWPNSFQISMLFISFLVLVISLYKGKTIFGIVREMDQLVKMAVFGVFGLRKKGESAIIIAVTLSDPF